MKTKITTKLANAERVADEAIQLALNLSEIFESFLDSMERIQGLVDQFPATRESLEFSKKTCARLREELES